MAVSTLTQSIPYLISLLTSVGIGLYAWYRQEVVGAKAFAVVALAMASWTLGYIFELLSPGLQAKIFWDNIQWITTLIIPMGMLAFALQYTGRRLTHSKWVWGLLVVIPFIFLLLVFTDHFHRLVRPSAWLVPGEPFDALVYDFTPAVWLTTLYIYGLVLASLFLLLIHFFRSDLYRVQVGLICIGFMFPLVVQLLPFVGILPTFQRDTSPFTFIVYNLFVAWGLFRYRLFDVVPVARDRVIENIPDAVIVLDARKRIIDLNPAARKIVEPVDGHVIGLPVTQAFPNWPNLVEQILDSQKTHTEISVGTGENRRDYELEISPLHNWRNRFTGYAMVVRTITRRKQVEDELKRHRDHLEDLVKERTTELEATNEQLRQEITEREQLEERLRQSQKMEAIGRLAGGIAHDFNNLLTVISGYSELLLRRHMTPEDPGYHSLEQIVEATEQAALLTQQLLAFSRKQIFQPKILNLNNVVANMEKMLRRVIGEDIELVVIYRSEVGQVEVDPGQIQQVIMNLVINARDAMPHGGRLTIETADVEINAAQGLQHVDLKPGAYVMLTVSDTGIGMDVETQEYIFEPFFTTKESGEGTGLGLATVYGIIKQSDGAIYVYSEPGQGATFKIYLPQISQVSSSSEPEVRPSALQQGTETILLVEDDARVRILIQKILRQSGYVVLEAGWVDEAIEVCQNYRNTIHLLITDIVMPGGRSGRDLAKRLISLYPQIRVLYMSGYVDDAMVRHGILDSDAAFLQKPFSPDALLQKVREVLDSPD